MTVAVNGRSARQSDAEIGYTGKRGGSQNGTSAARIPVRLIPKSANRVTEAVIKAVGVRCVRKLAA